MARIILAAGFTAMALLTTTPAAAQLSVGISVRLAPPPLPVYAQPPLPGPDYVWTPGYWAWDDLAGAYYWVPGNWMLAPRPGLLWTPPWWGWQDGLYVFHSGYWGPHVGFYGGVPYGFGYTGFGFHGGYWQGNHFAYNATVTNITNVHVTRIYRQNVVVNHITRVSYNGGPGGVPARPTPQELMAAREMHVAAPLRPMPPMTAMRPIPHGFVPPNRGPAAMPMVAPMPVVHRGHGALAPMIDARPAPFARPLTAWRAPLPPQRSAATWSDGGYSAPPMAMTRPPLAPHGYAPPRVVFRPAPRPPAPPRPPHGDHHGHG